MKIIYFLIFSTALLFGCADSYQIIPIGKSSKFRIKCEKSVFISIPKDGSFGNTIYNGSGGLVSNSILSVVSLYCERVETGDEFQNFSTALNYSKKHNYGLLIHPNILEWEDRATEWSSKPDRISIKIQIIDVQKGKTLFSYIVNGKSGLATAGGDRPQDLLPKPFKELFGGIFSK